MRRGDRVKLVNRIADKKNPLNRINWCDRRGTVVRISRGTDTVAVQWDNRPSPDRWPIRALEIIQSAPQPDVPSPALSFWSNPGTYRSRCLAPRISRAF